MQRVTHTDQSTTTPAPTPIKVAVVLGDSTTLAKPGAPVSGILPMVWREACALANAHPSMEVMTAAEGIAAVQSGQVDVLLDAIEMTPATVAQFNLSVPLQQRSLRAVVRADGSVSYDGLLKAIWHSELGGLLVAGTILGILAAVLMIAVERRHRRSYFVERSTSERIEHGLWWSIVTFATVGYGDVVPVTRLGRFVASCWMLISVLLVALMGSVVAAEFTVSKLRPSLANVSAIRDRSVAALTARDQERLQDMGAIATLVPTLETGVEALRSGRVDGLYVSDLDLMINHDALAGSALKVLPGRLRDTFIAIAYRPGLPEELEKRLNIGLVSAVVSTEWDDAARFLGGEENDLLP